MSISDEWSRDRGFDGKPDLRTATGTETVYQVSGVGRDLGRWFGLIDLKSSSEAEAALNIMVYGNPATSITKYRLQKGASYWVGRISYLKPGGASVRHAKERDHEWDWVHPDLRLEVQQIYIPEPVEAAVVPMGERRKLNPDAVLDSRKQRFDV